MHSRGAEHVLFGQLNIVFIWTWSYNLCDTVHSIGAWLHVLKFVIGVFVSHVVKRVNDVIEVENKPRKHILHTDVTL